ncbi:MAG: murein biosynthesis integral membrane protein MurJ [Rhodothermales bacterium]
MSEPRRDKASEADTTRKTECETAPDASSAPTVAAGILTSRILGFVRERAVAHFFGVGAHADVFQVAFRGPNLLQNLLGEGTISAAFIPIYSRLIEEGREEDAGRFAGAIFGLLLAVAAGLSLLGILLARPIVTVFTPGFLNDAALVASGELPINRFELAVQAVRIIFPMTGFLVLAAWCLGVLNSHRKFFLPYFAPVIWNVAIISALLATAAVLLGGQSGGLDGIWNFAAISTGQRNDLLFAAFYGALFGGLLQFAIQLPLVFRVLRGFRVSISTRIEGVREALRAFGPVVAGRGVYQLSSYLDIFLGSFLAAGAVSSLRYAQMLYILPVSLFGLSIAASELPELSRFSSAKIDAFTSRLNQSLGQMLFMTVPTLVGYLIFGLLIVGAIFQTGEFGPDDTWLVYLVLGTYSVGLLATTTSRLLQNAFYALNNTRTPAKIAALRVAVSAVVAIPLMFVLDGLSVGRVTGIAPSDNPLFLGAVGLAVGATVGAWIELWRLKSSLSSMVPVFQLPWRRVRRMTATALFAVVPALLVWWLTSDWHVALEGALVVATYAFVYLGASYLQDAPEMQRWTGRLRGRSS